MGLIPLDSLPTTTKTWGREELIYNDLYCMKLLVYTRKGIASSLHYHNKKTETFIVTSGRFRIELGKDDWSAPYTIEDYAPGESITLPPRTAHRIRCLEP